MKTLHATMFAFLAASLCLPACALDGAADQTPGDPPTATGAAREALGVTKDDGCPEGYNRDPDGTCLLNGDMGGSDTTSDGYYPTEPTGSGNGIPTKRAACDLKCAMTAKDCLAGAITASQTAACKTTETSCGNICLHLYPTG